jgi:hypothetical protein
MPTATQPLRELPEPQKNGPQTFGSSRKKQNGEYWQFAQRLYDHWHITAITVQYANRC